MPTRVIISLDALRGVAVLGILVINVRVFSMPELTLLNPTVYGDFTGANYWAWLVGHVFAELKFITVFSALFGAGIVLFIESKQCKGHSAMRLHYRRIGWLIGIGLAHAYLLWYGDILFSYGICGLLLAFAHDWSRLRPTRSNAFHHVQHLREEGFREFCQPHRVRAATQREQERPE